MRLRLTDESRRGVGAVRAVWSGVSRYASRTRIFRLEKMRVGAQRARNPTLEDSVRRFTSDGHAGARVSTWCFCCRRHGGAHAQRRPVEVTEAGSLKPCARLAAMLALVLALVKRNLPLMHASLPCSLLQRTQKVGLACEVRHGLVAVLWWLAQAWKRRCKEDSTTAAVAKHLLRAQAWLMLLPCAIRGREVHSCNGSIVGWSAPGEMGDI